MHEIRGPTDSDSDSEHRFQPFRLEQKDANVTKGAKTLRELHELSRLTEDRAWTSCAMLPEEFESISEIRVTASFSPTDSDSEHRFQSVPSLILIPILILARFRFRTPIPTKYRLKPRITRITRMKAEQNP